MGDISNNVNEKLTPQPNLQLEHETQFQVALEQILVKLKHCPSSITTEDARRVSESLSVEDRDEKSTRIIEAVEAFALANEEQHEQDSSIGQESHNSLLTIVNDLHAAVESNPGDVTLEVLRAAQCVVIKMQKALANAPPHPELEAELQEEIAKIEPKVAQGTVTKAEVDLLRSLETRAHGYAEKGGIAAIAQSVVARRERQMSMSSASSLSPEDFRTNRETFPVITQEQAQRDRDSGLRQTEVTIKPMIEHGTIAKADVDVIHSRETRMHGHMDKGGLTASAQSVICKKRHESLSDRSNVSPRASEADYERRKEQCHHDKEINLKIAELAIDPTIDEEYISEDEADYAQPNKRWTDGIVSEATFKIHRRENSQP